MIRLCALCSTFHGCAHRPALSLCIADSRALMPILCYAPKLYERTMCTRSSNSICCRERTYIRMYVCVYMFTWMYSHDDTHIHAYIHTHTHKQKDTCARQNLGETWHTYAYTRAHTYVRYQHIHTYYIHTNKHISFRKLAYTETQADT
jgi:hypothetical protein